MTQKRLWRRWGICLAAAALLSVGPATAAPPDGKGKKKDDGGINPSNIAVIDDDLTLAAVAPAESYDSYTKLAYVAPAPLSAAEQIYAEKAHQIATGKGIVVAVLDGGFNLEHPEIAGNLIGWGYDAIDGDGDAHDPGNGVDDDRDGIVDNAIGHGTFVSGMVLIAAPDAMILPVRVKDDEGFGTNDELLRGIRFAVEMGADVINLSVNQERRGKKSDSVWDCVAWAKSMGVTVVVSAGNDGANSTNNLATHSDVLIAGSVDSYDRIADFSNKVTYGTTAVMIFAPGVDLYGPACDHHMATWSGTSFSAGIISGAAALVLELHPEFGPASVCKMLAYSTEPVTYADGSAYTFGGRINLAMAVSR